MSANTVEVIIHPVCLRFRWDSDELVYMFAADPDQQLDRMERMLGVTPDDGAPIFRTNVGFLPVASTVLVRGDKTMLVDPGNHHIGAYSILWHALASRGLSYDDIDVVVTTHTHTDHAAAIVHLPGKPWVLGAGELAEMTAIEGAPIVEAKTSMMGAITEIGAPTELMSGVMAIPTPGHTAGHISLLVETAEDRVLIAGDTTMTRSEYTNRTFSQWYGPEQLAQLNASLDRLQRLEPSLVICGHDRPFRPAGG
ncbi:MAG: MBL fold metallo-hydrolase [Roseitalea sp.]|jgi:N-acyl homoserine lactone hydrolase|nr:MBL fold metallo-hydrolase [Roseitalea sp.]MBO6720463.1 MBL fold metallo-hydrolase [Roseitalea sp.]MBO6743610.1 MBL fold metallo-hydrolase [Roseitalea sp.]